MLDRWVPNCRARNLDFMYLIHAELRAPYGESLPPDAAARALSLALSEERVEHVSAHPLAPRGAVLGIFLLATSLEEAERRADALCRRLLDRHPAMTGWALRRAEAPLLAPMGQGLLGPHVTSSNGPELRRE